MVNQTKESYLEHITNSPAARTALLNGGVVLTKGQNVVEGGDKGETIHMDVADVEVPPHGMVVLQTSDSARIGVISFTDIERGTVTINIHGHGSYPIPSGEQIVVEVPANATVFRGDRHNRHNIATNNPAMRNDSRGPAIASNNGVMRTDSIGPANIANSNTVMRNDSRGPAVASNNGVMRTDSIGPANIANSDTVMRNDSRGPSIASNGVMRTDSIGPANIANSDTVMRNDSRGPAIASKRTAKGNGAPGPSTIAAANNIVRNDSRGPAVSQPATQMGKAGPSTIAAANNAMRNDSRGPVATPNGVPLDTIAKQPLSINGVSVNRLDSEGPAVQKLPQGVNNYPNGSSLIGSMPGVTINGAGTAGGATERVGEIAPIENSTVAAQVFPRGEYKDLNYKTYAASASGTKRLTNGTETDFTMTPDSADAPNNRKERNEQIALLSGEEPVKTLEGELTVDEEVPQIMKAMVKMPEEVPKELIWNTTYHHFRYWLPIHRNGAVGGSEGCGVRAASIDRGEVTGMNDRNKTGIISSQDKLNPIAFSSSLPLAATNIRQTVGSIIEQAEPSIYRMHTGNALFDGAQACNVVTPHGEVVIKKGAVVQVCVTPQVTYVRNLYDNSTHDVSTVVNNYKLQVHPGQEVAMVNGSRTRVRDIVYNDSVARRDLQVFSVDQDKHVAVSDFSHVNLMSCDPILHQIRTSPVDQDKKLYGKLEKMAAVITTVHDRTRAPYVVPYEPITAARVASKSKPEI